MPRRKNSIASRILDAPVDAGQLVCGFDPPHVQDAHIGSHQPSNDVSQLVEQDLVDQIVAVIRRLDEALCRQRQGHLAVLAFVEKSDQLCDGVRRH